MASVAPTAFMALSHAPPLREALSGVFGSISLAAWICLLLPQLIANYKAQSADGLSMGFLLIWLLGDATNLAGALFTQLAPTAIALACYFCIADVVLIVQCVYYNTRNARRAARQNQNQSQSQSQSLLHAASGDAPEEQGASRENEPLLGERRRTGSSAGLPGSHRHHAVHEESSFEPLRKMVTGEDDTPDSNPWLHNTLSLVAVWAIGVLGWFVSYKAGAWDSDTGVPDPEALAEQDTVATIGLVLGYMSAAAYLLARIPQIIKNWREKSCEGLALLFFLLSLTGNAAYGASLVAYSQEKNYLLRALPWLLGSLGTIVEDIIIFAQFHMYSPSKGPKPTSAA